MTWTYRELDKPLAWRLGELLQSLLVLRDSLRGLRDQQLHQIIPLSGQLRALLTERSGQAAPLLREIVARRGVGPSQLINVINKSLKKASFLSLRGAFSASKMPF